MPDTISKQASWPVIKFNDWKDTLATVHLWTQIVGKIRLRKMPWLNHSWHVTLYISPYGLSTGSMPYQHGIFQIDFDFIRHQLLITTSNGGKEILELRPMSVSDFYKALFEKLQLLDIDVAIYTVPSEMEAAIRFEDDQIHKSYDPQQIENFWQALIKIHNVFIRFRARFIGKCSPVHFFWGAFDLAVTRFSGRDAPKHPGTAPNMPAIVMQEAYSKEVSSCGFWPGNEQYPHASFYAYCYPASPAFGEQKVQPDSAFYSPEMGEFLLPYDLVQQAANPEETLLAFLQSTYEAAANTGNWDRKALECDLSLYENEYGCFK
ncbi:hypothetical protein F0L74_25960 [Chitinophaga agrisoli]|uniref:Ava_C0101 and related proteins n=1 Tax=Chitinophaga agrisoli TaxID=2607653 RepID=A0A5B2VNB7_9BACT|nr:DUF5996 family protein [Chitinophaga agrisoli]KAA2239639.1 hypothetical protein F0L74_25960 [Chitinophaga agrisoli]